MSEYDNTNSGVIWRPHPDQFFTGQGKLNVDGVDMKAVVIKEPVKKDGEPIYNLYVRVGPLFPNDKKGNDKAPDYSGPSDLHPGKRIAAWARQKDGRHYMSLNVSDRQSSEGTPSSQEPDYGPPDDEIPF